jgi:hypothetical protein
MTAHKISSTLDQDRMSFMPVVVTEVESRGVLGPRQGVFGSSCAVAASRRAAALDVLSGCQLGHDQFERDRRCRQRPGQGAGPPPVIRSKVCSAPS